jgi:hypothetical protein
VTLQLSLAGTNEITGTILADGATETATALRDNYSKTGTTAPQLPAYTMTLTGTSSGLPAGIGYASVTVDSAGNVRATGRLGDDTPFSVSSVLSDSGAWPFYAPLYTTAGYTSPGYIGGTLTFEPSGPPDIDGALFWIRPSNNGFGGYSGGFYGGVAAAGYVYTPPARGAPAIPLNGQHEGVITFSGGILNTAVTGPLSLGPTGALVSGTTSIKLALVPATGIFAGRVDVGSTGPLLFSGAVIQATDGGAGLFQSPTFSGQVEITSP